MIKQHRAKIIPFLLTILLLFMVSCQSKETDPSLPLEEMAVALWDMVIRDDPTALKDAFGYGEEATVYMDFEEVSERIAAGLETFERKYFNRVGQIPNGVVYPAEYLDSAVLTALSKLEVAPTVTELGDERAVLTFSSTSYDMEPVYIAIAEWIMADGEKLEETDPDFFDNLNGVNGPEKRIEAYQANANAEYAYAGEIISNLEPGGDAVEFQAVFVLAQFAVNGQSRTLWLPEDPEAFGETVIDAVFRKP